MMTNIVRFPGSVRPMPSATIPREEFERLAELPLDIVNRIVAILGVADGDPNREDGGDTEPSLGAPEGRAVQIVWARGSDIDREEDRTLSLWPIAER